MAADGAYASLENLHQAEPAACGMLPFIRKCGMAIQGMTKSPGL
jgi:hypothetical protein